MPTERGRRLPDDLFTSISTLESIVKNKTKKTKKAAVGLSFKRAVAVALARADLTQSQLAKKLGIPSTTLSDWLRNEHPTPPTLEGQIEKALGLDSGTLSHGGGA